MAKQPAGVDIRLIMKNVRHILRASGSLLDSSILVAWLRVIAQGTLCCLPISKMCQEDPLSDDIAIFHHWLK